MAGRIVLFTVIAVAFIAFTTWAMFRYGVPAWERLKRKQMEMRAQRQDRIDSLVEEAEDDYEQRQYDDSYREP